MSTPALAKHGSDVVKRNFLHPTVMGELIPCLGVSEPGAGSDVANIQTNAVKDGDDYVINGKRKTQLLYVCSTFVGLLLLSRKQNVDHQRPAS